MQRCLRFKQNSDFIGYRNSTPIVARIHLLVYQSFVFVVIRIRSAFVAITIQCSFLSELKISSFSSEFSFHCYQNSVSISEFNLYCYLNLIKLSLLSQFSLHLGQDSNFCVIMIQLSTLSEPSLHW